MKKQSALEVDDIAIWQSAFLDAEPSFRDAQHDAVEFGIQHKEGNAVAELQIPTTRPSDARLCPFNLTITHI